MTNSKIIKLHLFFLSTFILTGSLYGQERDFNLWTEIKIEKYIANNLKLGLKLDNHFKDNLNQRKKSFFDLGIHYDKKDLTLSIIYRFSNENEGNKNYSFVNRFSSIISYEYEYKRFISESRLIYQRQYYKWHSSEDGYIPEIYIRPRIVLRYDMKSFPIDPFTSFEAFVGANNYNVWLIEKQRISIGIKYKFANNNSLDIVFHKQNEKNQSHPLDLSIISISYGLKL